MNKSELIDSVAARTGLTKSDTAKVVNAIFAPDDGVIVSELLAGQKVQVTGFGIFTKSARKARSGRNPVTQAPMEIAASTSVKFSAGRVLKATVNSEAVETSAE